VRVTKATSKPQMSEARRKVRQVLCKSKGDPYYFSRNANDWYWWCFLLLNRIAATRTNFCFAFLNSLDRVCVLPQHCRFDSTVVSRCNLPCKRSYRMHQLYFPGSRTARLRPVAAPGVKDHIRKSAGGAELGLIVLQATDTPAQANSIRHTLVHKQRKIGPGASVPNSHDATFPSRLPFPSPFPFPFSLHSRAAPAECEFGAF